MKLYTVATALDVLGPDRTWTTLVHQVGDALVLVASGDFDLGEIAIAIEQSLSGRLGVSPM